MQSLKRQLWRFTMDLGERAARLLLVPANWVMAGLFAPRPHANSVLHISYMVHIPYHAVQHLRRAGMRADYLAIGRNPHWDQADFVFEPSWFAPLRAFQEFWTFWRVVARYETIHAHFMYTLSRSGWELSVLKRLGRKLVVHFRGCEARDRARNMALHPTCNICTECDHKPPICLTPLATARREQARRYGDLILVTTPDMLDFNTDARHFPFFAPADVAPSGLPAASGRPFKIVHVTNQPGIEGTRHIEAAIARLRARGFAIEFVWMHDRRHEDVMAALADADLAIGKMKMGYYANAQIESMAMGIPTVTHVRDEFMTDALRQSGFIFATLDSLEATLEHYLRHPEALAEKRAKARDSIMALHDNDVLARRLIRDYAALHGRA
jgi:glycosyltransferase involved in cell wall biosynthesis